MKFKYITIEREYASGGTEIAEKLSKIFDIPVYGREILEIAAANQNLSVEHLERYEESVSNSFLYSLFVMGQLNAGSSDILPTESKLYIEEHNTIIALANKGSGIFVGHCASEALKDMEGVLHVFIRADEDFKINRAIKEYGIEEKNADSVCKRYNKKRANYYSFNTSKKWDDMKNYDLVLDSSTLGIDGCVEIIASILR
ncbi:MAG: cytidylate kinase-like family protein [Ruminococcaceae bacterium]|nr:cytidylate kinase-like family protein [Oscillospiraceae bacterium]